MEKTKENKVLSVSERMKAAEIDGAKVAKIMNKARTEANKVLKGTGYIVDITLNFCKPEDLKKDEVTNG